MNYIRIIMCMIGILNSLQLFAQEKAEPAMKNTFNKEWQQVDTLLEKGLPESAKTEVEKLLEQCRQKKNIPQQIKAIIYLCRIIQQKEEDSFIKIISLLKKELQSAAPPAQQIIHYITATQYWNYYQNHLHTILSRSITENDPPDIDQWDAGQFIRQILFHYEQALTDQPLLSKEPIENYQVLLNRESPHTEINPTLFEFLTHQAIDFFSHAVAGLSQTIDQFSIADVDYFLSTNQFVKLKISSKDPLSFSFKALTIYQALLRQQLLSKNKTALLFTELKRLKYLWQQAVIADKNNLYEKALLALQKEYQGKPLETDIDFELAEFTLTLDTSAAEALDPMGYKKKAHAICTHALKKFPASLGAKNCQCLIKQIETKILDFQTEKAVIPNSPFKALLRFQNITTVYCRLLTLDKDTMNRMEGLRWKDKISWLQTLQPFRDWQIALPAASDFRLHSTEIPIEALKPGQYILLVSNQPHFSSNEPDNLAAVNLIQVSNIAYLVRNLYSDPTMEIITVKRDTGQPFPLVQVEVLTRFWDQQTRKNQLKSLAIYHTDQAGYLSLKKSAFQRQSLHFKFSYAEDSLELDDSYYLDYAPDTTPKTNQTFFFTDRSIYRPGQIVYFKGIVLKKDENQLYKIIPNHTDTVFLNDVNSQEIAKATVKSNEFGTFSGSFPLPPGRLNGQMQIYCSSGSQTIQVEEYKRPAFKVEFMPLSRGFQLQEQVRITGKADAYAGFGLDGAQVKYRVVREVFYPYFWTRYYYPLPTNSMEIINESTQTNHNGEFTIEFTALPDPTIQPEAMPAFSFQIYAAVTDINGETQTGQKTLKIGSSNLLLRCAISENIDQSMQSLVLPIQAFNLNDELIKAKGEVKISLLTSPAKAWRQRLWQTPDLPILNQKQHQTMFPDDCYLKENDVSQWPEKQLVFRSLFDTAAENPPLSVEVKNWPTGKYRLEISSTDSKNKIIKEIKYFTLFNADSAKLPLPAALWIVPQKTQVEPGQQASFLLGSSQSIHLIYEIMQQNKLLKREFLSLCNQQKQITYPIEEIHRGNITIHFRSIYNNRAYSQTETIFVPWTNKELTISFASFRSKLKPGDKEEWQIHISGPDKEKVAAEMVASLYDQSLDSIMPHRFNFSVWPYYSSPTSWISDKAIGISAAPSFRSETDPCPIIKPSADQFHWFGLQPYFDQRANIRMYKSMARPQSAAARAKDEEGIVIGGALAEAPMLESMAGAVPAPADSAALRNGHHKKADGPDDGHSADQPLAIRKNLNETAFFYPQLTTAADSTVTISFTLPESLTSWKLLGLVHSKDLKYRIFEKQLIAQKELMVIPNLPRFLRENDRLIFSGKIKNLTDKTLSGHASLDLLDSITQKSVNPLFQQKETNLPFTIEPGQSISVAWPLEIPQTLDTVTYRIVAKTKEFSDGQEGILPILKNRMLVTETMPLPIQSKQTRKFQFDNLQKAAQSPTLSHYQLTLEMTENPVWYAILSLPYLMEYPHECLEQIFNRYYANRLAAHIMQSNPLFKSTLESWRKGNHEHMFMSKLAANSECKSVVLEETPWVMAAQAESEQRQRLVQLFEQNKLSQELKQNLAKIKEMQLADGSWPWFLGMQSSRYITQYICAGFVHLLKLKIIYRQNEPIIMEIIGKAVAYLDRCLEEDYQWLLDHQAKLDQCQLNPLQIYYFYIRSYFQDVTVPKSSKTAFSFYFKQMQHYWLNFNQYGQGLISLALFHYHDRDTAESILKSLKEHAIVHDELGMYWKNSWGYGWDQSAIETQALMIEVFHEIAHDLQGVDLLKTWLLKQKQTQAWTTSKSTAEACYALLLRGTDWISESQPIAVTLGTEKINPAADADYTPGIGYYRIKWSAGQITPAMGTIELSNPNPHPAWAGVYWQYFEDLDKISSAASPLKIEKTLFLETPSPAGPVLKAIHADTSVKIGDRIKVQLKISTDRTMEFIHLKDMRAPAFEPEQQLSGSIYQQGLFFYNSIKDASMNYFIDRLPKGTYTLEYALRVSQSGDFSNGIATIQCMYAPEFASHSNGIRIKVKE